MANSKKDYVSKYKGEKIDELLEGVETLQGEGEGSVNKIVNDTVAEKIAEVVNDAPEDFDTLKEMSDWITGHENSASTMNSNIAQLRTETDTLNNAIVKKQDTIQYDTMPEPTPELVGKIIQYVGDDTQETRYDVVYKYNNGKFYKCIAIGLSKIARKWKYGETIVYTVPYPQSVYDFGYSSRHTTTAYNDVELTSVRSAFIEGVNTDYISVALGGGSYGFVPATDTLYGDGFIYEQGYIWQEVSVSKSEIDDIQSADNTTYSSNKINNLIGSSNNLVKGYYNETDKKFYEEAEYQTEITGEVNKIYISLDTDKLYYWNGSEYKLSSGGSEGSSGHIITNSLNEEQTEREKLKFSDDFNITDNEANDSTEISERLLTNQEINDILDNIPTVNEEGETVINNIIIDVPVGTILPLMQETAPDTYLICDGTEYLKADYPELSNVLLNLTEHTQYEGSDEDHFKVPDLRGEFLRGSGVNSHTNQGSGDDVGEHQDGTYNWTQYHSNNGGGHYYDASGGVALLHGNADKQLYDANYYIEIPRHSAASQSNAGRYTSRPTNTSVLYCIKAVSKETHNQAIVSSTIVNEQDNEYNGIPFRFAIDEDGNYGYIKDGADTITPFNSISNTKYSLEEKVIGAWINDKPLYRLVRNVNNPLILNGLLTGTLYYSSQYSNDYRVQLAFDENNSTGWLPKETTSPSYIGYTDLSPFIFKNATVKINIKGSDRSNWVIQGSTDGTNWTDISNTLTPTQVNTYTFSSNGDNTEYTNIRLYTSSGLCPSSSSGYYTCISTIEFYSKIEYDTIVKNELIADGTYRVYEYTKLNN